MFLDPMSLSRSVSALFFEVLLDRRASHPESSQFAFPKEGYLIGAVFSPGLGGVAVSHESLGLQRGRELYHGDPGLAADSIANALFVETSEDHGGKDADAAGSATGRDTNIPCVILGDVPVGALERAELFSYIDCCIAEHVDGRNRVLESGGSLKWIF